MSIKYIQVGQAGLSQNLPSWVYIETNDTIATVTTAGYLNGAAREYVNTLKNNMMALISTKTSPGIGVMPVLYTLQLQNNAGVWSLVAPAVDVPVPFIVLGNIQAGQSGTAGALLSYPATAAKGYLELAGVANTGNTATIVSNVAMGQASTLSIPDPVNALGRFMVGATATPFVSGNLPMASGTGGLFVDSGIPAANIGPLVADGTFPPALNIGGAVTGITYSAQVGYYTRIGNTVTVNIFLILNSIGVLTGALTITGLPVSGRNSSDNYQGLNVNLSGATVTGIPTVYITGGTSTLTLYQNTTGTATALTNSNIATGSQFIITGTYLV